MELSILARKITSYMPSMLLQVLCCGAIPLVTRCMAHQQSPTGSSMPVRKTTSCMPSMLLRVLCYGAIPPLARSPLLQLSAMEQFILGHKITNYMLLMLPLESSSGAMLQEVTLAYPQQQSQMG